MARKARISAAILAVLTDSERHAWTLDELQAGLVRQGLDSDFSSVFRAAEKLVVGGMLRKVVLDDGRARVELVAASSRSPPLYALQHARASAVCYRARRDHCARARDRAAITDHHLVLNGICVNCRAATDAGGTGKAETARR